MAARKPLDEGCEGGVFCPVEGHLVTRRNGIRWSLKHIQLTTGQRKTLREHHIAEATAARTTTDDAAPTAEPAHDTQ